MKPSAKTFPLLAVLFAATLYAQEYRGRVQGLVTDQSGAVVEGAVVRLVNVGTNVEATRQTDSYGRYLFDLVEPGQYSLVIELQGFSRFLQERVLVQNRGDITPSCGSALFRKLSPSPKRLSAFNSTQAAWI